MKFLTDCTNSTAELIDAMIDSADEISHTEFATHVDADDWIKTNAAFCIPLHEDWHVTFHKSNYNGNPCVYFQHSGIEHIFTEAGAGWDNTDAHIKGK